MHQGKLVLLVRIFEDVAGIMSVKTHLKGAFGFNGFLDLAFLFIEYIWHYVQKGYGSILSSTSFQKLAVYPSINYLVDMCPNLWYNNSKATLFLGSIFFDLVFSFVSPQNACFLCELCDRVTTFYPLIYELHHSKPFVK